MIVLPECGSSGALAVAERVRAAIADELVVSSFGAIKISLSLGVATADRGTPLHFDDLISSAHSALYKAKANGRNCVMLTNPD